MYVRFGDDWVGLAEPGAAFGPLSVAVRGCREASGAVAGAPRAWSAVSWWSARAQSSLRRSANGAAWRSEQPGWSGAAHAGARPGGGAARSATPAGTAARRHRAARVAGRSNQESGARRPRRRADAGRRRRARGYAAWGATADRPRVVASGAGPLVATRLAYLRAAEHGSCRTRAPRCLGRYSRDRRRRRARRREGCGPGAPRRAPRWDGDPRGGGALRRIYALISPAAGAAVMASGIVSVALALDGRETPSRMLLVICAAMWTALGLVFGVRVRSDRKRVRREAQAPAALAAVVATEVRERGRCCSGGTGPG